MKTKVFYNNRQINGRFTSFKTALNRAVRFVVRWSLISAAGYALFMSGAFLYSTSTVTAEGVQTVDLTPAKIEALKLDLVTRLSNCERAGHAESEGIIIFDSNAKASVGVLQFQIKTVQSTYKEVYGTPISGKDAVSLALDKEASFKLAEAIIFNNIQGGIENWHNCAVKKNLIGEVALINKLAK